MSFDKGVGSVVYPGIQKVVSASYSRSHGITPDVCQVEMAPQPLSPSDDGYTPIEPDGYLLFQFDEYTNGAVTGTTKILMQGCRPDKASVRKSASSENWTIPIYDRRWKWKYGSFSGHWNIKKNGVIEPRKERTARQLADMCLEAMGESRYNTSALDDLEKQSRLPYRNKVRPEVHWDRIPPAQALNDLVTPLGYRVCLKWNDTVSIEKYGEGALLPTADLMTAGFDANLPEIPDSTTVLGGISMHEAMWYLEPVGLDLDGDWRPIDHLSYAPRNESGDPDWSLADVPFFTDILAKYNEVRLNLRPTDDEYKKRKEQYSLAQQTAFRCYRLMLPLGTNATFEDYADAGAALASFNFWGKTLGEYVDQGKRPGDSLYDDTRERYEEERRKWFTKSKGVIPGPRKKDPRTGRYGDFVLEEYEQILPIFQTRSELTVDSYSGKLIRRQPEVTGIYFDSEKGANTTSIGDKLHDNITFDVIPEQGIIRFSKPLVLYEKNDDGKELMKPANLRVLIATPLKNTVGEPSRYTYSYETPTKYRTKPAKLPGGLPRGTRKIPGGTDTKVLIKNEIVQTYQARYEVKKVNGTERTNLVEIVDNSETEDLEKQAKAALDVESLKYMSKDSGSGVYAGLKAIDLDGAIQQVAISRNTTGGMITTVARNTEVDIYVPTFDERQRNQALKEMIQNHNNTVDNTQQVNPEGS